MRLLTSTLFLWIFAIYSINAQIVISEIMYDPPEAGQDSLEYIELYNALDIEIDISGYYFSDGVEHTFEEGTIFPADSYLVVAKSSSAMMNVFGIDVIEWKSGALNNTGEPVILNAANDDVIASVIYSNRGDWPREANGGGYSLEICNLSGSQADPGNWNISNTATGIEINGKEIYASPGTTNSSICDLDADYVINVSDSGFSPAELTIGVGETVLWTATDGTHNINGSQDAHADNPEDVYSGTPEAAPWHFSHTFNVGGKYTYHSDSDSANMIGHITVLDDLYPFYLIREVTGTDADGVADSIGVTCTLTGIATTPSYRTGGLTFVIQEADEYGITVFTDEDIGYNPAVGDEVMIRGTIAQFNGLTEIEADSIFLISEGNEIYGPVVITEMNETNENTLVTMKDLKLVDPGQWREQGSFNVDISDGVETFEMRIYEPMGFQGLSAPEGTFDVTGAVGQFDSNKPYLDGYQLMPRSPEDINPYETSGPEYPKYEIAEVTQNGSDGRPDSLGVNCTLEGIVIRDNFRDKGYQFVMTNLENTAGITVFSADDINGYRPKSGDIIEIKGQISFFNGLTEIDVVEVDLLSSGNELPAPIEVVELSEETESRYVVLGPVSFTDQTSWPGDGESFNKEVVSEESGNTYTMRVDRNTELADSEINLSEEGWDNYVTIRGVGTQFDNSEPYDQGYQIMPFDASDINRATVSVEFTPEELQLAAYPNPVSSELIIESAYQLEKVDIYNALGELVQSQDALGKQMILNLVDMTPGIYHALITTDKGQAVMKLIKE